MSGARRPAVSGPVQIAYLVDDLQDAAERHSGQFGSGPFFAAEHIPLRWVIHRGQPARFDHSSAYGWWGVVMVELVVVHAAEPESLSSAVRPPDGGIHHVARFADDLDAEGAHLDQSGCPQVLLAETERRQRFAFHDGTGLGHLLEIYEPTDGLRAFYRRIARAAEGWTGFDPIRAMSQLEADAP